MRHVLPIYLSDVVVSIVKKTAVKTVLSTFKLKNELVKGFNFSDFIERNQEFIFASARKKQKIPTSKEFEIGLRIDKIILLKQLGFGVED